MSSDEEEMRAIRVGRQFKTRAERREEDAARARAARIQRIVEEEDSAGDEGEAGEDRESDADASFGPSALRRARHSGFPSSLTKGGRIAAETPSDEDSDEDFGPQPLASAATSSPVRAEKLCLRRPTSCTAEEDSDDDASFGPQPLRSSPSESPHSSVSVSSRAGCVPDKTTGIAAKAPSSGEEGSQSDASEPERASSRLAPLSFDDDEDFLLGLAPEPSASPAALAASSAATSCSGDNGRRNETDEPKFRVPQGSSRSSRRKGSASEEEQDEADEDDEGEDDVVDPEEAEAAALRTAIGLPSAFGLAGARKPECRDSIVKARSKWKASSGVAGASSPSQSAEGKQLKRSEEDGSEEDGEAKKEGARGSLKQDSDEDESEQAARPGESAEDEWWRSLGLPVSLEVSVPAHQPSLASALALNPKANRMATGGSDGVVRFWDFQGMTSRMRSYRQVTPVEKHTVEAMAFSSRNDLLLVASGDSQCRVYNSQDPSQPIVTTTKGDMYIRDVSHTKGHTHKVLDCHFHPLDKNLFVSCGLDASVRLWDLNAPLYGMLQTLPHVACLKAVDRRGLNSSATHCTSCMFTPTAAKIVVVGCADGSLQMWGNVGSKKNFGRPDAIVRDIQMSASGASAAAGSRSNMARGGVTGLQTWRGGEGGFENAILSLRSFRDDYRFVSRGGDGLLALWDLRKFKTPVKLVEGLPTASHRAGVCLSPDEKYVCTTSQRGGRSRKEKPFDGSSASVSSSLDEASGSLEVFSADNLSRVAAFPLAPGVQPLRVEWPQETNQVLCSCSDGSVSIFFDRTLSQKGALLFVDTPQGRRRREEEEAGESLVFAKEYIFVPGQLPDGYKETFDGKIIKVKPRGKERLRRFLETQKTSVPPRPAKEGYGGANVGGGNRSQHLLKKLGLLDPEKLRQEEERDPVEALRAYAAKTEKAGLESQLISRAYAVTQPNPVLNADMEEEDEDEFLKHRERCPRCALRMCQCGYMEEMEKRGAGCRGDSPDRGKKKQRTAAAEHVERR
ncbi:WD domain, G-beta repeat-containing protein [Toxoplasma gondii RUB]|uniref:WD domain, G-beta repeat-containing protein n=1 Tax=Toxoplasma gondii RUB TaxID=935652 RepID=A0A086M810_TOXGO|nr:WD domain, G-beta repeat-containing protein [Toxoplasma gondii RUB]